MNRQEFMQMYNLLDAVYDLNFESKKLDIWYTILHDIKHENAMVAANKYIATEKYKPKPADIIKLSPDTKPQIYNRELEKCGLCTSSGFIGVEHLQQMKEGMEPFVFFYRCKCSNGQANSGDITIITDDIINSRHRDIFGIYRLEQSNRTEVKREDFRKIAQNFGRW